jgi:hypothetical protein
MDHVGERGYEGKIYLPTGAYVSTIDTRQDSFADAPPESVPASPCGAQGHHGYEDDFHDDEDLHGPPKAN